MPFVERSGVKIYYEDSGGSGEVLFLTHGFGSGSRVWDKNMELSNKFRIIRWDMRGHAKSDSPDDPSMYNKQHQVDDMLTVLDACGVQQAVFLGWSMGAYDNMLFYLSGPEYAKRMKALIIVGSGPGFAKAKAREGWNQTADKISKNYADKGLEAKGIDDNLAGHTERGVRIGLAHSAKYVFGQRDNDPLFVKMPEGASVVSLRLKDLKLPVLLIIGSKDKGFLGASQMMNAKIPGSQFVLVEGAGHTCFLEQPELFNKQITAFIDSLALPSKL